MQQLVDYFDEYYVRGPLIAQQAAAPAVGVLIARNPPRFPPQTWNYHELTLGARPRTNNFSESWNGRYSSNSC